VTITSERTNVAQTAAHYYELVDRNDVDGLLGLFAPDAVYHRPGYPPLNGRSDLERFYGGERVIAEGKHSLHTLAVDGGTVAVHGEFAGTLKDGSSTRLRFADFFVVGADGRFSRRDTFFFSPMV
jgi:steroid Delta-isomerase